MAVVASCLADQGSQAAQSGKCFDQSQRASEFLLESERLLRDSSCVSKRDGLKALRASFLLNPTREAALRLAEVYEKSGFPGDGRWYRTAAAALGTHSQQLQHFTELLNEPSLTNHRYFAGSSAGEKAKGFYALSLASRLPKDSELVKAALGHISQLAQSTDRKKQDDAIQQAQIIGPKALPAISKILVDSEDISNQRSAKQVINKLTMYDNRRHSWVEETISFFRGSPYEKYLPKESY